jgi:hypothetical protein
MLTQAASAAAGSPIKSPAGFTPSSTSQSADIPKRTSTDGIWTLLDVNAKPGLKLLSDQFSHSSTFGGSHRLFSLSTILRCGFTLVERNSHPFDVRRHIRSVFGQR